MLAGEKRRPEIAEQMISAAINGIQRGFGGGGGVEQPEQLATESQR